MSSKEDLKPPVLATWIIEQLGNPKAVDYVLGDLHELFIRRVKEYGLTRARILYWIDTFSVLIFKSLPQKAKPHYSKANTMEMVRNYFITASRNFLKQKFHSGINIIGLSVGFAFSLLIFLYVAHELSYDRFHTTLNRTYLLPMTWHFNGTTMPTGANCSAGGPFMKEAFPEVEEAVRISVSSFSVYKDHEVIKESGVYFADSAFFKVFSFQFLEGNPGTSLTQPFSVVLTERMAEKYFGLDWKKLGLVGKTLEATNNKTYQITGVVKNPPSNSHLQFNFVVSFSTLPVSRKSPTWDNSEFYTYLLLNEHSDTRKMLSEIPEKLNTKFFKDASSVIGLDLVPLSEIYLRNTHYKVPNTSNVIYIRIFGIAAILVLLIATINYINMTTARAIERAQEVGVRKVMGAQRVQLFYQFLSESLLVTSLSLVVAIGLVWMILPFFSDFVGKSLDFRTVFTTQNIFIVLISVLGISMLAGSYPAFFISGYKPVRVLKGKLKDSYRGILIRKGLVVGQFLVSILMITCSFMISDQINFIQNKDLGFNRKQLVSLSLDSLSRTRVGAFKNILSEVSSINGVSATFQLPTNITHETALSLKNETNEDRKLMTALCVDSDFLKTVGLEIVAGTGFTPNVEKVSDSWEIFINQSAADFFGWTPEQALEKELKIWQTDGVVKGVVKDFHFASLHNPIAPLVIFSGKGGTSYSNLLIHVSGTPDEIRTSLQSSWKKMNPDSPFLLTFLDDQYESLYLKETLLRNIVNVFAFLAILISTLGLFGLASYTILQRTKELGIRKVLGATAGSLIALVSGDFIRLVSVSFIFALPVSWYLMNQWLSGFSYHISFNWRIAIFSGLGTIILALLTVVYHSLAASRINPAETLRSQ